MKKNVKKSVLISALSALAFGATGMAGTFALFTDKAETTVQVKAGVVDIDTKVSLVRYESSVDDSDVDLSSATSYTNNLVGSSFALTGNQIVINKMVPGDALTIKVKNVNKSNVRTKTRFIAGHGTVEEKKDLFPALQLAVSPVTGSVADLVKWKLNEPSVNELGAIVETELNEIEIRIEFPNVDNVIYAREKGANNAYQDAACTIGFAVQAIQGNAETDIIDEINAYLTIEGMIEGTNQTMYDAVTDVRELGYDLANLQNAVYSVDQDQFVYESSVSADFYRYFKIYNAISNEDKFSVYASNSFETYNVNLQGRGFDAGDAPRVDNVSYTGVQGSARDTYIRTNSIGTNIVVDAPADSVRHFGDAALVTINGVALSSYHEFGTVAFLEVAQGRVVLEESASLTQMHFLYNEDDNQFDEIVVAYAPEVTLPTFSRDTVQNIKEEGTLVVELQNSTEPEEADSSFVWLFQQGLVDQIRISESKDEAGDVTAVDQSIDEKTYKAADDIANTLRDGSQVTQQQIASGTVPAADIVESGLEESAKEEKAEAIISEIQNEELEDNAARIRGMGFESINDAIDHAIEGDTIVVLKDTTEEIKAHGDNLTIDLNSHIVTAPNNKPALTAYESETITVKNGTLNGHIRVGEHKYAIVRWRLENDRVSKNPDYGYHPLAPVENLVLQNLNVTSNKDYLLYFTNVEDDIARVGGDHLYGQYIYKENPELAGNFPSGGYATYDQWTAHNMSEVFTSYIGTDLVTFKGGSYSASKLSDQATDGLIDVDSGVFGFPTMARYNDNQIMVGDNAHHYVTPASAPESFMAKVGNAYFAFEGGADAAIEYAKSGDTIILRESSSVAKELGKDETLTVICEGEDVAWTGATPADGYDLVSAVDENDENMMHYSTESKKEAIVYSGTDSRHYKEGVAGKTVKAECATIIEALNYTPNSDPNPYCGRGTTVKLMADVVIDSATGYYSNGGVNYGICWDGQGVLDFNGHTITYHGQGGAIVLTCKSGTDGAQTVFTDTSAAQTGGIIVDGANSYCIIKKNSNTENVIIDGGNYISQNGTAIRIDNSKTITIDRGNYSGNSYWLEKSNSNAKGVTITGNGTYSPNADAIKNTSSTCIVKGTKITLANGEKKNIEDVLPEDEVLTWNFMTGSYDTRGLSIIVDHGEDLYTVTDLEFEDDTGLSLIGEHGIFDYDLNEFVYLDINNYVDYLGHRFAKQSDDGVDLVRLTAVSEHEEITNAYSITSAYDFNVFADDFLAVAPPREFYNWMPMGDSMQYDMEQLQLDIETYGLYTYEDFMGYVTEEQFELLNGQYLKIAVEKGIFTFEYILGLIEEFGVFFL